MLPSYFQFQFSLLLVLQIFKVWYFQRRGLSLLWFLLASSSTLESPALSISSDRNFIDQSLWYICNLFTDDCLRFLSSWKMFDGQRLLKNNGELYIVEPPLRPMWLSDVKWTSSSLSSSSSSHHNRQIIIIATTIIIHIVITINIIITTITGPNDGKWVKEWANHRADIVGPI